MALLSYSFTFTFEYESKKYIYHVDWAGLEKYDLKEFLGQGTEGFIFAASNDYVVKFVPLDIITHELELEIDGPALLRVPLGTTENRFTRNIESMNRLREHQIFVPIEDYFINDGIFERSESLTKMKMGIIVMKRWDMNLKEFLAKFPSKRSLVLEKVNLLIHNLATRNYFNGETGPENIMIKINGCRISDVRFIDAHLSRSSEAEDFMRRMIEAELEDDPE